MVPLPIATPLGIIAGYRYARRSATRITITTTRPSTMFHGLERR